MNYSHRFWLYGPVSLFALLMLAVVTYWFVQSAAFARKLDALNGHEIAPGITLHFQQKSMGGFPFRLDTELDGLRVTIATSHGPAEWDAEHFAMHSLTYGRTQYVFEAAGQQVIRLHKDSGALRTYHFLPGLLRGSMIGHGGELGQFDLEALAVDSGDISASQVQFHLRKDPKIDGVDIVAFGNGVHIAQALHPAFGPDVKSFRVEAMVSPGSSFDGLLKGHKDWRAAAEDWRARHGGVLVKNLQLEWNAMTIAGKGALTVDGLHRPMGALHVSVKSWQSWLSGAKQLILSGANNGLAPALLSGVENDHANAPLNTTLTFQDGVAYVGSVPADMLSPLY